jgi:hypothetical protein
VVKYEEKFIVFNKKHLEKMPKEILDKFDAIMIEMILSKCLPPNKYYVCNQDEPYAEEVINIILQGEKTKQK